MPGKANKRARRAAAAASSSDVKSVDSTEEPPKWMQSFFTHMAEEGKRRDEEYRHLMDLYARLRSSTPLASEAPEPLQSHHRSEIESRLSDNACEIKFRMWDPSFVRCKYFSPRLYYLAKCVAGFRHVD